MSNYNFFPSINSLRFIRSQTGDNTLHRLNDFETVFEVALELEIGGLNYINNPVMKTPVPFYLTFVTYSIVGGKETVLHGFSTVEYDSERLANGENEDNLTVFITKFRNDETYEYEYNFVTVSFGVKIIYSNEALDNLDQIERYFYDSYNCIFETKIPYINNSRELEG